MPEEVNNSLIRSAKKLTDCLVLDNKKLKKVMNLLENEFQIGLKDEESATIKMLITYVRNLPNNSEKGRYLALDLGGTNFRVILIDLNTKDAKMESEIFKIADELMTSDGSLLFDFIADCIIKFTEKHNLSTVRIALGFTFSFPCVQYGLCQAKLVTWTKGFNCPNVVGRDVVKLLKVALRKRSHDSSAFVDIVALINDTTGTLMACAHKNPTCDVGLIVGTGTNACYIEKLENIEKWPSNYSDPKHVIINTEWGAFGDNKAIDFIRTEWDTEIDSKSINVGKQTFEKMVSGLYLGEIVRHVLLSLIGKKLLFNGQIPQRLTQRHSITAKSVSKIDLDFESEEFRETRQLLDRDFTRNYTQTDLQIISLANSRVSKRAAYLVATGCATLLNRIQRPKNTIAYDGSVIKLHPHFKEWVNQKISELISPKLSFELMLSEDGSGRGAAIVAAVSYGKKRPKIIKKDNKVYEILTYIH